MTTPTPPDTPAARARTDELEKLLAETMNVRYVDHIASTNCADWQCKTCGLEWVSPSKLPCPACAARVGLHRYFPDLVEEVSALRLALDRAREGEARRAEETDALYMRLCGALSWAYVSDGNPSLEMVGRAVEGLIKSRDDERGMRVRVQQELLKAREGEMRLKEALAWWLWLAAYKEEGLVPDDLYAFAVREVGDPQWNVPNNIEIAIAAARAASAHEEG